MVIGVLGKVSEKLKLKPPIDIAQPNMSIVDCESMKSES